MKQTLIKFAFIAGLAVALSGCYPGGVEYTSDTDLVYTNYDPEYNFGAVQTYLVEDTIRHYADDPSEIETKYDSQILADIKTNLNELGWQEFDLNDTITGNKPDIVMVTSILVTTTYDVYYYPYYGYGWYWKSTGNLEYYNYGWYYPWYGTTYVTSYTTGTVAMVMYDPDLVDNTNKKIKVSWAGILNGLAGGGASDAIPRISNGIDQAFRQSPYLSGK